MKYLETNSVDCRYNLAFEEYCFENLDPDENYVSLWKNDRTIVVGRYQNTAEEINAQYVTEHSVTVVRRLSGGGAVYHDLGNLNYTFIADSSGSIDFARFTQPVIRALSKLGVRAELSGRNDLTINGKKFSGNAQYSKNGRTMHHGTLMFSSDLSAVAEALRPPTAKLESKSVKSVRSRVTNICEHTSATMADFTSVLLESLFPDGVERYELSEAQLREVGGLRTEKYDTREWNYGKSPPYTTRIGERFQNGYVELLLDVQNDRITHAAILGDFFGAPDITELERALVGARPTRESVADALSKISVETLIYGVTRDNIVNIFI